MRLFAAVVPPPDVLDHLASALALAVPPGAGRAPWLPRDNWHLTVAFYGEVPGGTAAVLIDDWPDVARGVPAFDMALSGAGTFHRSTAWIGAQADEKAWRALARALAPSKLGVGRRDERAPRNRPHLTVARGASEAVVAAMHALAVYRGPAWRAEEVVLFASALGAGTGGHPRYDAQAVAPLRRP